MTPPTGAIFQQSELEGGYACQFEHWSRCSNHLRKRRPKTTNAARFGGGVHGGIFTTLGILSSLNSD